MSLYEDLKKEFLEIVNFDNLKKLLENCTERDVVDEFYKDKFVMNDLLKELITSHRSGGISASAVVKFGVENRKYCDNALNIDFCSSLLQSKLFDLEQFIKAFREAGEFANLLKSFKFFEHEINNNFLTRDDIETVVNSLNSPYEWKELCNNHILLDYTLKEKILSFDDFLRTTKISDNFNNLLQNQAVFKLSLNSGTLKKSNVQMILDQITDDKELDTLLDSKFSADDDNRYLLKWSLEHGAFSKKHANRLFKFASSSVDKMNSLARDPDLLKKFLEVSEMTLEDFAMAHLDTLKDSDDIMKFFSVHNSPSVKYVLDNNLETEKSLKAFSELLYEKCDDRRIIFNKSSLFNNQTLTYLFNLTEKTTRDYSWLETLTQSAKESQHLLKDLKEDEKTFGRYLAVANEMYNERNADKPDYGRQFDNELIFKVDTQELLGSFNYTQEEKNELFNKLQALSSKEVALGKIQQIVSTNLQDSYKTPESLLAVASASEGKRKSRFNF